MKTHGEVGVIANVLLKQSFQRSIERRNVAESSRPVCLWADEAQNFITSSDFLFQTTARSSLVSTVYMTQSVSNYYARFGGTEKGKREGDALLANLNTKILHANSDPVTNEWASTLVGRRKEFFVNGSNSYSPEYQLESMFGMGYGSNMNAGFSESYEFELQPSVFPRLRTGGPSNKYTVDAILFQNGRVFSNGRTWMPVTFRQRG